MIQKNTCFVIPGTFLPFNDTTTQLVYKQLRLLPLKYRVCALKNYPIDKDWEQKLSNDENYAKFDIEYVDSYKNLFFSRKNPNLFKCLKHVEKYIQTACEMYQDEEWVYTSSWPCYTTRAGIQIKKKNPTVKWIANFTDPINHSPYKFDKQTYQKYSLAEKIGFKLYCKYFVVDQDEAIAFEYADYLIFICEEQRDFMIQQYITYFNHISETEIRNKSIIVPLNYVPQWNYHITPVKSDNHIFRLSHFGRVYGLRYVSEFLHAIQLFSEKYPDFNFIVEQFGEFPSSDLKLIKQLNLNNKIIIYDKVPYDVCMKHMLESNAVLLFDTILPETQIQPYLPSKIQEYSLLEKDVLSITTTKSPTYRIAKASNAIVCSYNRNHILNGLEQLLIQRKESKINYKYTNQEAIQELYNIVRQNIELEQEE